MLGVIDIAVIDDGVQHESSQSKIVSNLRLRKKKLVGDWTRNLRITCNPAGRGSRLHDGDLGVWPHVDCDGVDTAWPAKEDGASSERWGGHRSAGDEDARIT